MDSQEIASFLSNYKYEFSLQLRWGDMDSLRHVNNANYLTYLEEARLRFLDHINWPWETAGLILARVEMDYITPLVYEDKASIRLKCGRMGNKSFDIEYVIFRKKEQYEIVAKAKTVLVCFDYTSQKSIAIGDDLKKNLEEYL